MNWLRLAHYGINALPLALLLLGYGTILHRNRGRIGGYARALAQEHCLKRVEAPERALIVSRPNYWPLPILLAGTLFIPSQSLSHPPSGLIMFATFLTCGAMLFFNWLHLQSIMSAVVVTTQAVYWCDFIALPPDIRQKRLAPGMEVFYTPWGRDQQLWVDGEPLGRLDFANSREIRQAVLEAVAALGQHKAPVGPPA